MCQLSMGLYSQHKERMLKDDAVRNLEFSDQPPVI